jgi:hypothetical protein
MVWLDWINTRGEKFDYVKLIFKNSYKSISYELVAWQRRLGVNEKVRVMNIDGIERDSCQGGKRSILFLLLRSKT